MIFGRKLLKFYTSSIVCLLLLDSQYMVGHRPLYTCIRKSKLSASNSGIYQEKGVITYSAPLIGIADFQTASHVVSPAHQSQIALSTNYRKKRRAYYFLEREPLENSSANFNGLEIFVYFIPAKMACFFFNMCLFSDR